KSFAEVGESLRISEDAARKRVTRALERLRDAFARRGGLAVGSTALAATLSANLSSSSASAAAVTSVTSTVLGAGSSTLGPVAKGGSALLMWAALKPAIAVVAALVIMGSTVAVLQVTAPEQRANAMTSTPTTAPVTATSIFGRVVNADGK